MQKCHYQIFRARNYIQNLGFHSENQRKKLGFREIFRVSIQKIQVWGRVSENVIIKSFDSALWFLLSRHVYASCRHEFWSSLSWSEQELCNGIQHAYVHAFFLGFPVGKPGPKFGFPSPFLSVSEIRKPSNFEPCNLSIPIFRGSILPYPSSAKVAEIPHIVLLHKYLGPVSTTTLLQ